jgi:Putative adhesin
LRFALEAARYCGVRFAKGESMKPAFALLVLISLTAPARAQMRDNRDTELTCNNISREISRERALSCEVRESTLGPSGRLQIEPGHNGGITVKGWAQNSVFVRARLEAWAENDIEARNIASQIRVETAGGQIRATGPDLDGFLRSDRYRSWAVSLEIFTPWNTDLTMESHNGGITISDIRGQIDFQSHNGGVRLARVAGDVKGETHNGEINVELNGNTWEGRQLELSTHNGGVTLLVPASYSASLETESNRGRLDSDFPVTVRGRLDEKNLNFNIGTGGPLIKVSTHNGGIRVRKN